MAFAPSSSSAPAAAAAKKLPEIITIPEQFYGVALKLKSLTSAERDEAAKTPPPPPVAPKPAAIIQPPDARRTPWAMIGIVGGVILLSAAGFVYFNREALFKKQVAVVAPPTPPPVPVAPSGLSALASQGAISLSWTDAANNEQGYHIERKDGSSEATFLRITTLPANSTAFIDVTVQPSASYTYHVIAGGEGGDSAPSNDATASMPALPVPEEPKPMPTFPPGGLDSDSDGLTDQEELIYTTSPQGKDSDGDRFLDGNEVFHLYNPAATAPGKLIESGLVRSLSASSGWVMYVPANWTSALDPADANRMVLQTGRGEQIVASVETNTSRQELAPWVAARINQPVETLGEFTTKGGLRGVYSPDRMQAWLAWGDAVFRLTYDLQAQPFVNFRTTLEMMLNSLSLNGAAILPTTLTPANSGPGSLLSTQTSSTSQTAPVAPVVPATTSETSASSSAPIASDVASSDFATSSTFSASPATTSSTSS